MWYVAFLLLNSNDIKSSPDIESDTYNDLLILEKEIRRFDGMDLLSKKEKVILDSVINSISFARVGKDLGFDTETVAKTFHGICYKLALSLGGVFTDDGYLDYMQEKYSLTPNQMDRLKTFITSEYKYRVMQKIIDHKETK